MSATGQAVAPVQPVLVGTKLHVPQRRPGLVPRPDLVARLTGAQSSKLTLICAPPGWGKTVLLSEWHASPDETRSFAWLSLDPSDDDPVRFWAYAIAALRTVDPGIAETALAALPTAGAGLVDAVVAPLINDLASFSQRLVLVLDDYHLVHAEAIHDSVAFLLRHLPQSAHLAIATRADPPLPLASLRAAGEITEIRAEALRFSYSEANALLNDSLCLGLDQADVDRLQARTEGWAAGLQLAALSVQAQQDRGAFIEAFAGDDRQIGDYLHEVLDDQPAALRDFLLRTSILERMCAPLCDVLTGAGDAATRLEEIERANLFLVPLDSRREWYRYHQLFRDLLRQELAHAYPDLVGELHRCALAWYREHGDAEEAIAHATAAGDFGDARELIAQYWLTAYTSGRFQSMTRWIDALPREAVLSDVRLCVARAWCALHLDRLDEAASWRRTWEPLPESPKNDAPSPPEFGMSFDGSFAKRMGDVGRAKEVFEVAVALCPDETDPKRGYSNINLGATLYYAGETERAAACLQEALRILKAEEQSLLVTEGVMHGYGYLAAIRADLGELGQAERLAAEGERLIREHHLHELPWGTLVHVARGKLLALRGDLPAAETALAGAVAHARRAGWPLELALALLLLAQLEHRRRDHSEARSLVREARQVLDRCPDPGILRDLLAKTERMLQLAQAPATTALPIDVELSERELAILRLLASELSQREIGSELFISLNTVKGHVRNVFRKLGVATRADAVARGRELGLI